MENQKYKVVRLDANCLDSQYEQLSRLLNGGYFICNEYKFPDFVVFILRSNQTNGIKCELSLKDIKFPENM